jgi:hypothetical protein
VDAVEEALVERCVERGVGGRDGLGDPQYRCHRGEEHGRGAGGGERAERLGQQRGPDEVDGEDPPPVGHGWGNAGRVGHGAERAELADAGGEAALAVAVGDVEDERFNVAGARRGRRQSASRRRYRLLVEVDEQ